MPKSQQSQLAVDKWCALTQEERNALMQAAAPLINHIRGRGQPFGEQSLAELLLVIGTILNEREVKK